MATIQGLFHRDLWSAKKVDLVVGIPVAYC